MGTMKVDLSGLGSDQIELAEAVKDAVFDAVWRVLEPSRNLTGFQVGRVASAAQEAAAAVLVSTLGGDVVAELEDGPEKIVRRALHIADLVGKHAGALKSELAALRLARDLVAGVGR